VGVTAVVDAPLRPTGKIRIGEDVFEAHAAGEWVERGAQVKVLSVSGSRFQVEKI
jgi:membrane-bound ClpP family serine protease